MNNVDHNPDYRKENFTCPLCGVVANMQWETVSFAYIQINNPYLHGISVAQCSACKNCSIWFRQRLIYPTSITIKPNKDLPEEIKSIFTEAGDIVARSPKGAAALLRLTIQKLVMHLGQDGENLNKDIGNLVSRGIHEKIQQALDIVRISGNQAVHPGQINWEDDANIATSLFQLINIIADHLLTEPKMIDELYQKMPQDKLEAVKKRDGDFANN
jgi:arsenate reductase-like glutaredoxin family protein